MSVQFQCLSQWEKRMQRLYLMQSRNHTHIPWITSLFGGFHAIMQSKEKEHAWPWLRLRSGLASHCISLSLTSFSRSSLVLFGTFVSTAWMNACMHALLSLNPYVQLFHSSVMLFSEASSNQTPSTTVLTDPFNYLRKLLNFHYFPFILLSHFATRDQK